MVIYKLDFSNQGKKHLQSLDKTTGQRIFDKLRWLVENVDNVEHLQLKDKYSGLYKLKVGAYRAIYEIDYKRKIITVHKVGHRRDIYK